MNSAESWRIILLSRHYNPLWPSLQSSIGKLSFVRNTEIRQNIHRHCSSIEFIVRVARTEGKVITIHVTIAQLISNVDRS